MKKFLEFIWVLIGPAVIFISTVTIVILLLAWVCTGFGIMMIMCPILFPSPLWVRWFIGIFDCLCLIVVVYGAIQNAYQQVYKN